jgi:NADPH:quinone reductase-like Zn-dependent oxidoreductase
VYGIDGQDMAAYAEYKRIPAGGAFALKPEKLTHEEAASVPFGSSTAMYFLVEVGKIQQGDKVLVVGASGNVGLAAVQIAKASGASVTGVCRPHAAELVRSVGADSIIDFTRQSWLENGETYDLVVDTVCANKISHSMESLREGGAYLAVAGGIGAMLQSAKTRRAGKKTVLAGGGLACEKKEFQIRVSELVEADKYRPVIDKVFRFDQIVDAHRHFDQGQLHGAVVISVAHG